LFQDLFLHDVPETAPRLPLGINVYSHVLAFRTLNLNSFANRVSVHLKHHPWLLVNSTKMIQMVNRGETSLLELAILSRSRYADYMVEYANCSLVVLHDSLRLMPQSIRLMLQKDSPHLDSFNWAIRALKADGTLQAIERKYWTDKCSIRSLDNCSTQK